MVVRMKNENWPLGLAFRLRLNAYGYCTLVSRRVPLPSVDTLGVKYCRPKMGSLMMVIFHKRVGGSKS